ncbi:MAG: aldo/keto reductase [Deltaproteobacteria bacterium]
MRFKLLGRSGLRVSEICLGTMTFGEEWGFGAPKEECRRIFEEFAGAGGNFLDTANMYTNGTSERFLGEFLGKERDRFVLATKYTLSMRADDPNASGNHRKNLVQSLEGSLARLRTDYVDLLWLHAWDFMTPIEEVMRALDDVVRAGKVRYVGVSDTPAWVVSRANLLAELRGWSPFVGLQIEYSLIQRTVERELIPMANELDIAVTAWGAIGGGVLSGKYSGKPGKVKATDSRRKESNLWRISEKNLAIAREVGKVAREIRRTPSQVALAWVRQQPGVIIPILGVRTLEQLRDNLGCLDVSLDRRQMDRLGAVSAIEMGFPYDFLAMDMAKKAVYGDTFPRIDNHRRR